MRYKAYHKFGGTAYVWGNTNTCPDDGVVKTAVSATDKFVSAPGLIKALATTGTIAVNCEKNKTLTITPTDNCTINANSIIPGQLYTFIITTSGTTSYNITFNTNFKSAGVLATGTVTAKVFTVTFIGETTTGLREISRTGAM